MHTLGPTNSAPAVRRSSRLGAWFLAFAPAFYLPAVALNAGVIAPLLAQQGVGQRAFVDLSRDLMDVIQTAWIPFHASLYVATAIIPIAVVLGVRGMMLPAARGWRLGALFSSGVAIPLVVVYSVLDVRAISFTTPTLGEDPFYAVANVLGYVVFGLTLVGLGCLAVILITTRWRPVLGWILAVGAALFLVVTVIAPLYTPPFVTALIACPLGVGLLRVPRRLREQSDTAVSTAF
mgnify:CR=1 FL=1